MTVSDAVSSTGVDKSSCSRFISVREGDRDLRLHYKARSLIVSCLTSAADDFVCSW